MAVASKYWKVEKRENSDTKEIRYFVVDEFGKVSPTEGYTNEADAYARAARLNVEARSTDAGLGGMVKEVNVIDNQQYITILMGNQKIAVFACSAGQVKAETCYKWRLSDDGSLAVEVRENTRGRG